MKHILNFIIILFCALTCCDAAGEKESQIVTETKAKTIAIAKLAKANDIAKIESQLRPAEESKLKRHAATKESVIRIFKDIDPDKLKFGITYHYPEKKLIIVKIDEPIRMDLEYYFDADSGAPPRLQALHP